MAKKIEESKTYQLLWEAFQTMSEGSEDPDADPQARALMGVVTGYIAAALGTLRQNPVAVDLALQTVVLAKVGGQVNEELSKRRGERN